MIKYITVAIFVAAVSAAPSRSENEPPCSEAEIAATGCLGPKDCMYPYQGDCAKFIHCEVNADNRTGRVTVKDCPAGLEWNDNEKLCDWPASSTCGAGASTAQPSTAQPTTAEPSTEQPSTARPSSAAPSTGAQSTSAPGGSENQAPCSEEEIAATGCMGPKDCLYPNPENCNQFIHCEVNADNKTGRPTIKECPQGLEWNDNKKECDWPSESTCGGKGSTAQPTTAEPSTEQPSTARPSSAAPSTNAPSTEAPSTSAPSTSAPGGSENQAPCSEEEIAATACKGPKDCLYPNPENCNSYIQCEVNADNKTGRPTVRPCPDGLEWNDNDKICDWPASSTCNGGSGSSSSAAPTTAAPTTAEPSTASPSTAEPSTGAPSTNAPSTGAPSTNAPSTKPPGGSGNQAPCSEEEIAATGCKGPKDCLYPNPENCNSYIQCEVNADNKTGRPTVRPCPDGLEWNDNDKICDWPASSTCNKPATPGSTPSTTASPTPTPEASTPSQTTASSEAETTTEGGSGGETTPTPTEAEPESTPSSTTTLPSCRPEDDDNDSDLDLNEICGSGCNSPRTVAHPSNNGKYIICSSSNSVRKCAQGLLYSKDQLSCTYAGLVDSNGPSSRS